MRLRFGLITFLVVEVGSPSIDHAKGREVSVEGLAVQFTHALNHLRFVFASHVDLAGDADAAPGQRFISMADEHFVVGLGACVAGGDGVMNNHSCGSALTQMSVGAHHALLSDDGVYTSLDKGLNQAFQIFESGVRIIRRSVVDGNPHASSVREQRCQTLGFVHALPRLPPSSKVCMQKEVSRVGRQPT